MLGFEIDDHSARGLPPLIDLHGPVKAARQLRQVDQRDIVGLVGFEAYQPVAEFVFGEVALGLFARIGRRRP
jgi:hypothetical protein